MVGIGRIRLGAADWAPEPPTLASMKITSRAAIYAAFGVGPLLMAAGCGGDTGTAAEGTLAQIQPTSFVEVAPATTTTTTVAPTDTTPGRAPGEQAYTIRSGDSISKIAALHDITMDQLVAYNSWPNGLSHNLFAGDVVKIPPGASVPGAVTATADATDTGSSSGDSGDTTDEAASTGDGDCPTTYTIKSGDNTRIGVAAQFDITYEQMDAANAGTPGYSSFVVGTEITIPCP